PPSTLTIEPVMKLDASLARKIATGPSSGGNPYRFMAAGSTHHSFNSGWWTGDISVRKYPGAIAFTRIPCGAHSAASALVNWWTAALDERYDACHRGWLTISADIEPT